MSRLLLFGLALWGVGALQAGSIGPDCGSCFGAKYTLETTGFVDNGNSTQTWGFTYKIDTSDAAISPTKSYYIGSVAVKVTSSNLTSNAARLNSFSGTSGEKWAVSEANINNGGCEGSGQGWVCFSDNEPAGAISPRKRARLIHVGLLSHHGHRDPAEYCLHSGRL